MFDDFREVVGDFQTNVLHNTRTKEGLEGRIHAAVKQATARYRAKASTRPEDEGWSEGVHRKEAPAEKRARKGEGR